MKPPVLPTLLMTCMLAGLGFGQEAPVAPVPNRPTGRDARAPGGATLIQRGGQAAAAGPRMAVTAPPQKPLPPPLNENINLKVTAELADGHPVAFSLTGIGSRFQSTVFAPNPTSDVLDTDIIMATLDATVSEVEGGYQVIFTLSYSIPGTVEQNGKTTAQYHNLTAKSTVVAKLNAPVEIAASNGKVAILTVSKPAVK